MSEPSTLKWIKMREDYEFQQIGKGNPYKVPIGFFENISEETLLKAKNRDHLLKKSMRLRIAVAVAASIVVLFTLGYLITVPEMKSESLILVQESEPATEQVILPEQDVTKKQKPSELSQSITDKTNEKPDKSEEISDILAEFSDDDLSLMAAMYQTDPFIHESEQ